MATDFSIVDKQMEAYFEQREAKGKVYQALSEYIETLEYALECEDDFYKKHLIQKQIKKFKKVQKEYYVPSILGESKLQSEEDNPKKDLEKSSFKFVKKLKGR